MKVLTFKDIKSDIKHIISKCGVELYVIQFIMILFNVYSTYKQYSVYPKKDTVPALSDALFTIIEMLVTAILTIIIVTIINKVYEAEDYNKKEVIANSIKKLPRFILGYLIIGGLMLGALIAYSFIQIILRSPFFAWILGIVLIGVYIYILIRFCLAKYILVIEKDSGLVSRSKEFYMMDKVIMIKYFIVAMLTGIIPITLFISLPGWLGMELSKTAFLVTRLIINVINFILTPLISIAGLSIYKYFIGRNIKRGDTV
ncbi:hypothetical protein [Vallitalea maricola]|uniref:Uncharacterized protein n=1 Tax=Vallitalea maricola TaxID=3074433 RepID=A0ACB5UFI4_9FIRM|nr:hypothetical protein AN2V17_09350 [Vallitalea sp. AN17-2]